MCWFGVNGPFMVRLPRMERTGEKEIPKLLERQRFPAAGGVARIHASAAIRCKTKPIQKAMPKNSWGVRPENRLVAKNIPMMWRMVATAIPMEKARIIHSRCRVTSRRRIYQNALHSAKRKNEANSVVAAA